MKKKEEKEGKRISVKDFNPHGADPLPLPLCLAKTGRTNLNEEFTPLLPTGICERF
jgi:hypothetical protein